MTSDTEIPLLRERLVDVDAPLSSRFKALFTLKQLAKADQEAVEAIAAGFNDSSALLKHELAYVLGQSQSLYALPILESVLSQQNGETDEMVRHEAAEALGAIGDPRSLPILKRYLQDEKETIRQTCELAIAKIEHEHSGELAREHLTPSVHQSIDPAPPLQQSLIESSKDIAQLQNILLDRQLPLFKRYRAMFALREIITHQEKSHPEEAAAAVQALGQALLHDDSALLRHEVAYVFGQICTPLSVSVLMQSLNNKAEAGMVRHEAAEALGSLIDEDGVRALLESYLDDPVRVVRESCIVACDMADFEGPEE